MKTPKDIILPSLESIEDEVLRDILQQLFDSLKENHRYYADDLTTTVITIDAGDTSPDVQGGKVYKTNNSSPTTITTFDNAFVDQEITIIFGDANTTIATSDNIILNSSLTGVANGTVKLVYDGTNWREVSRSSRSSPGPIGGTTPASGTFTDLTFTGPTGRVIQVVSVIDSAESTLGNTAFPYDDTIPQKTEGMEVMTLAITPTNANSILVIQVSVSWSANDRRKAIIALFQDTTANALNAMYTKQSLANTDVDTNTLVHRMIAGTTSATTFKVRIGPVGSATITKNGTAAGGSGLGGVETSSITITEILP